MESALSKLFAHHITTVCAGRTDAGVHGLGQVVHFDSDRDRSIYSIIFGTNAYLPTSIRVLAAKEVASDFNARFSAVARQYVYKIDNSHILLPHRYGFVTHFPHELNLHLMNKACLSMLGEHDFTSFRAASCQSKSPFRHLKRAYWEVSDEGLLCFHILADSFLQNMVRNIVGVCLQVGQQKKRPRLG